MRGKGGKNTMQDAEVIVIGSGIGGLVAGALLARYGRKVIVCESHTLPGGAAHSFSRQGFQFDSGPSFYCGLSDPTSLNPLRQVLEVLGESTPAIAYDPLGHYHFPEGAFPVYSNGEQYRQAVAQITPQGAQELAALEQRLLPLYDALKEIPTLALRADWRLLPFLLTHYPWTLVKLLPQLGTIQSSVGEVVRQTIRDPWVKRLIDLECFLLSGLKADGTIAPEVAFMFGERSQTVVDYPIGGGKAIVDALVRGLRRWGGELCLGAHVAQILVENNRAIGVTLRNGETLRSPVVISNASIWDTYTHLLDPKDLPTAYRQTALTTPAVDSFMHLHLGIQAEGLEDLTIHHVVIHDAATDISTPGNTCMISIPTVLDPQLAPSGCHLIHAYTLEPWTGWRRDQTYESRKQERAEPLFRALEKIIPDLRSRIVLTLIGSPLTHERFLRRHQGSYGPAISAGQGSFPSCQTPIAGLYRVGDSTLPGIGVPAVAASGVLCANTLVSPRQTQDLLATLAKGTA